MSNESEVEKGLCDSLCAIYMGLMGDINNKLKELKEKKGELGDISDRIKDTLVSREIDKVQLRGGSLRIKVEKKTSGLTKKLFESFLDKELITKLYEEREVKEVISLKFQEF